MVLGKFIISGSTLIAVSMLSGFVEHLGDAPFYASANVAVVRHVAKTSGETRTAREQTRFSRSGDGLYYVVARVNGTPVRFVLDTGATLVVLTAADAKRVGLAHAEDRMAESMETAGGVSAIQRVTLDRVKLAGHSVDDVDAAIVSTGLKTSLLGQNFLAELGPITLTANEVELH